MLESGIRMINLKNGFKLFKNKYGIMLILALLMTCSICFAATNINTCTITITGTYNYDSYAKNATYTIVDPATGRSLVEKVDYSKEYVDNVDAGTNAKIVFTGRRNYTGTVTKTFTINKRTLNVVPNSNQSKLTGSVDPDFKFTYNNNVDIEYPEFTGKLSRVAGEAAGNYNILKGTLAMKDHGLFKASNYNLVVNETIPFKIEDKDCLTLEFTVPAGATLTLPIPPRPLNDFIVSWGDSQSDYATTEGFIKHTYTDAGTYTVRVSGRVEVFGFLNDAEVAETGMYKNYYSYCNYLTKIVSFGNIKAERLGFSKCKNLAGTIPTRTGFDSLISVENMFNGCEKLTGSIPTGFFKNLIGINSAKNVFKGCKSLTGSLEATLFEGCSRIRTFEGAFSGCIKITGSIPENLFKDSIEATSFDSTFYGMTRLSGAIPSNLFKRNTIVHSFAQTFGNCSSLTSVPEDIFEANTLATNYYRTFYYCRGFTEIPIKIFTQNRVREISNSETILDDYNGTFQNCTGITYLESDLFLFGYKMFAGCSSLQEILLIHPAQIGDGAFRDCNNLKTIKVSKEKLYEIGENAFYYSGTNPNKRITYINKDNEVLLNFAWDANRRAIDITPPKGFVEIVSPTYPYTNTRNVVLHIDVEDEVSSKNDIKIAILNDNMYEAETSRSLETYRQALETARATLATLGNTPEDLERKAALEQQIDELTQKIHDIEMGEMPSDALVWENFVEDKDWVLSVDDGVKAVYVYFKDEMGNISNFEQEF